jgi:hypothetical protein
MCLARLRMAYLANRYAEPVFALGLIAIADIPYRSTIKSPIAP